MSYIIVSIPDDLEYLRVLIPDINGIARSKLLMRRAFNNFANDGITCFLGIMGFSANGHPNCRMRLVEEKHYGNGILIADWSTLKRAPYATTSDDTTYYDIITSMYITPEIIHPVDIRSIAQRAIKNIGDLGFTLKSTFEIEFRLFKDESLSEPVWSQVEHQNPYIHGHIERFCTDLERNCAKAGLLFELMHTEYGSGQLEVNVKPAEGIKAADQGFMFRLIAKDVARNHGMYASFMTKPFTDQTGNAWHYNLSLWKGDENAFYKDGKDMSKVAKHFIAGLVEHGPALLALCAPTVNCYRRIHTPWAPHLSDLGVDSRLAAFRAQTSSERTSRIENRLVCSAANPYLALAATLFAGEDGIRRKLKVPTSDFKELPHTFLESFSCLKSDSMLAEAFGAEFLEWLQVSKEDGELQNLSNNFSDNDISAEIKEFAML